jgi:ubiquinone/menaquinone biosynthesis C-methylase UbiE
MRLTSEERKRKFFYAAEDAEIYDYTVELTQPYFHLMHDTLITYLNSWFDDKQKEITVLDIGSGTGIEALNLLKIFPRVKIVAIDFSQPMNDLFIDKLNKQYSNEFITKNISIICDDFLSNTLYADQELAKISNQTSFDIIMTAFVFQHFTKEEKEDAYLNVYRLLKPNGIFINCDIFGFYNDSINSFANQFGLNWIINQLSEPNAELMENLIKIKKVIKDIELYKEKWVKHWNEDNILFPTHSESNSISERAYLKNAGFKEIEIIFRYWLAGIMISMK